MLGKAPRGLKISLNRNRGSTSGHIPSHGPAPYLVPCAADKLLLSLLEKLEAKSSLGDEVSRRQYGECAQATLQAS